MKDGRLETFTTSLTGEVFAILQKHSVLVPDYRESNQKPFDLDSFLRGVDLIFDHPVSLLQALFSTRSRWISSTGDLGDPSSYLSGILIGSDINAALSNGGHSHSTVEIIGEPSLCKKYADAMLRIGRKFRITDGVLSSYSGFRSLKPN
jgi:2-dehydro-3-deoxygalactonokinase